MQPDHCFYTASSNALAQNRVWLSDIHICFTCLHINTTLAAHACYAGMFKIHAYSCSFAKRLHYVYLPCIWIPLFIEIIVKHHTNYIA